MRFLKYTVACLSVSLNLFSMATPSSSPAPTNQNTAPMPMFQLYAAPDGKQLIEKISPQVHLVPFFQQADWVKVGDTRNGNVGWVNKKQYAQAMRDFYQPELQMVYVHNEQDNKTGKPIITIVAYKNGQKLSDAEAKKIYEQLQYQQQQQAQSMEQTEQQMQNFFQQEAKSMNQLLQASEINPMLPLEPGPVIIHQGQSQVKLNNPDTATATAK